MAILATKNFATLVTEWAAVVQSNISNKILSFTTGSVLRALAEAQAAVSLWLQGLTLQLLTVTRLSTSSGTDCDTFVQDFGLTRLPARASTGLVTFSRVTPTNPATVPIGSTLSTSDGSQTFSVYADPTNSAYSASANGYIIPAQVTSLNIPVQDTVAGAAGNVNAGTITILQTAIPGVDSVSNSAAFTNGFDAESDAALRARFVLFIASLSKATEGAIGFAIQSVQQGMQYQIFENQDLGGTIDYGAVTVYVDDGSGNIPLSTLTAATNAAQLVRAAGVRLGVFAATMLPANITMTIITSAAYNHNTVVAQVIAAINAFVNGVGLGNTLSYMQLAQVVFNTSPGITDLTNYTINGTQADLMPGPGQTIKAGAVIVS